MTDNATNPAVSVILPVYNAGDYIGETIKSVLSQTFTDFEVLVLDNASTDHTPSVVASFTDSRIRYRRNAVNLGFAGNVQLGRTLAAAPYVVVFNADDIWDPTYLAKAIARLEGDPRLAFVHAHILLMDEHDRCYGEAVTEWGEFTEGREAFLKSFIAGFSSPTMLIRNEILQRIKPLPSEEPWAMFADSWLFLQLCLHGDVGFISEPLMRYRVHSASMMAASYSDGSFFQRRLATARDAFSWPVVQAWGVERSLEQVERHVAIQAATLLPSIRTVQPRSVILRSFLQIVREAPTVLLHPKPWARLALGLLPGSVISHVRIRRRMRWVARNRNLTKA